ncbi:hypothetical protein ACVWY3_004879 [Bradyrhizobium sp. USDA 4486]
MSIFLYRRERLVAVKTVNKPGDNVIARRIPSAGVSVSKTIAADVGADLKQFADLAGVGGLLSRANGAPHFSSAPS